MKAAQKLLDALIIGGGSVWAGSGGGGSLKKAIKLSSQLKYTKTAPKNGWFPALIDLKIAEKAISHPKVLFLFNVSGVIHIQYTPPAIRIRDTKENYGSKVVNNRKSRNSSTVLTTYV